MSRIRPQRGHRILASVDEVHVRALVARECHLSLHKVLKTGTYEYKKQFSVAYWWLLTQAQ
jgi:hypothetical protein